MPVFQGKDSFTLIELLIVTTLLAILGTVVVVVLNPAEMMKQSRDSQRLVDLNQLNKVLSFIQVDQPALNFGSSSVVYVSIPDASSSCANLGLPSLPSGWSYACSNSFNYKKINGSGWVPVNFTLFSAGSPISKLPIDPVNATSTGEYYTYVTGGSWKLTARLVSEKYIPKAGTDSGSDPALFEQGNDVTLAPFVGGMVGWWTFEETGTTASDSSGFANNGTMYSSSTVTDLHTTSGCKSGSGCGNFDGVDDWIDVGSKTSLNALADNFTVGAWVKTSVNSGLRIFVGRSNDWRIQKSGNTCQFEHRNQSQNLVYPQQTNTSSEWLFLVGVFSKSEGMARLYINGVLVDSKAQTGTTRTGNTQNQIGNNYAWHADGTYNDYWWNGLIDDVRIYNRALSAAEIKAIYDATK